MHNNPQRHRRRSRRQDRRRPAALNNKSALPTPKDGVVPNSETCAVVPSSVTGAVVPSGVVSSRGAPSHLQNVTGAVVQLHLRNVTGTVVQSHLQNVSSHGAPSHLQNVTGAVVQSHGEFAYQKAFFKPRMHTKISFGVVLTRINPQNNRAEAALVRMRYSYAFADFVHGHYSTRNPDHIKRLFDRMTLEEKLDVLSLNFELMWFRIWLGMRKKIDLFNKKLAKFQSTWLCEDGGDGLKKMIRESKSAPVVGPRWTLPKGRRQSFREPDINCAIREFREETGVDSRHYRIFPEFKRKTSHVDMGVRYVGIYYAALVRHPHLVLGVDLKNEEQVGEVSEVRWMDIEQMRLVDSEDRRLERVVSPIFRFVKRVAKGVIPTARAFPDLKY